jgi:hypothetical protein
MQELSEVFYTFLITSVIGCILATGRILYKSKCKEVNCCCLKFIRDTETELKEDIENNKINEEKE